MLLLGAVIASTVALALPLWQAFANPPADWPVDLWLYAHMMGVLGLLLIAGALAYRAASALTLSYALDRNGLYITWLGNRAVIPLDQIQSVDLGISIQRPPWGFFQGIGYYWGQARTSEGALIHLFTSQPPARSLVIYMPTEAYAISPADHEAFVQDLEQRRNLGATQSLAPTVEPSRIFLYAFWNDHTVRLLLIVAVALNLLMAGLLAARYPSLGPLVQMRFNAAGGVAEAQPRHQVLFLPLAAFGLILLNTGLGLAFYRRQQLGVRLLQGASVVVQVLFGIAVATIIR